MMKKALKSDVFINCLLFCISVVIACILGEFVLRAFGYYGMRKSQVMHLQLVEDDILDYRLKPNSSWIYNNLHYKINAHGWRDTEHAYEKPPDTIRIVVLGDSVTHGYGVNLESTYAKQLEQRLNQNETLPQSYEVLLKCQVSSTIATKSLNGDIGN